MKFSKSTHRLALSYLLVIMAMSLSFSAIIYSISSSRLNRPLPPPQNNSLQQELSEELQNRLDRRDAETKTSLLASLALLNIMVAIGGAALSYYLARLTLRPIEAAMDVQTQFISDVSHELRTPLTVLQTSNEVALRKTKITDQKAREVINKTIIETGKMRDLTNGLLDLIKTDQSDIITQTFNMNEFIKNTVARLESLAEKKQIEIKIESSADKITTNQVALEQIMTILIDNAIKYSSENTEVKIIGAIEQNSSATISVIDQGHGIDTKDIPHIFDRFYRSDSSRTRTETSGYGLGLAIAQQLAQKHNYSIDCQSSLGQGSIFSVKIK